MYLIESKTKVKKSRKPVIFNNYCPILNCVEHKIQNLYLDKGLDSWIEFYLHKNKF